MGAKTDKKIKSREDVKRELLKECRNNTPKADNLLWISDNNYEMINPKCVIHKDGYTFRLRYAPIFDTPFEEDQPSDITIKLRRLNIEQCELLTSAEDVCLTAFLMLNPANKTNGGKRFKLNDSEKEAKIQYDFYDILDKAAVMIREADLEQAKAAYSVMSGLHTLDMFGSEVRLGLRKIADEKPQEVIDAFADERTVIKYKYMSALRLQYLDVNDNETAVRWTGSDRPFLTIVAGTSMKDKFADYCLTADGKEVYEVLCEKLKK